MAADKYEKIIDLVCEWFGNYSVMAAEDWDNILIEADKGEAKRRGNVPIWNEEGLSNEEEVSEDGKVKQ